MNFVWKELKRKNSPSNNIISVVETIAEGIKIKCFLYITPQMDIFNKKRIVFSKIFFKTDKTISKYLHHAISDDLFELSDKLLLIEDVHETMFNEYFLVKQFPSLNVYTFGDYTKDKKEF